jgi:hypothetical protein
MDSRVLVTPSYDYGSRNIYYRVMGSIKAVSTALPFFFYEQPLIYFHKPIEKANANKRTPNKPCNPYQNSPKPINTIPSKNPIQHGAR